MENALHSAGFRVTRQRRAIVNCLASTDSHPSARWIFQESKRDCPGLSLATVYNTLDTLMKMGLIKSLDFDTMENRHETNLHPHINLICSRCGKIQDFNEGVPLYRERAEEEFGFEMNGYRLEYYGICSTCRARDNGSGES